MTARYIQNSVSISRADYETLHESDYYFSSINHNSHSTDMHSMFCDSLIRVFPLCSTIIILHFE